jgi:hypothetical protein
MKGTSTMAKKDDNKMAAAILTASISEQVMKNVPIGKLPDALVSLYYDILKKLEKQRPEDEVDYKMWARLGGASEEKP